MNINELNISETHTLFVLYKLIYSPSSYEFVSELSYHSKDYFKNGNSHKKSIISILVFALSSNKIIVERVLMNQSREIEKVYKKSNYKEFISILEEDWSKFINSDEVKIWYSYQINYTSEWKDELRKLSLWAD